MVCLFCFHFIFTDFVSDEELVRYFQDARVYCQLSYVEGTPAGAGCQAMACNCVPVLSEKAEALTEDCGHLGYYVEYGDIQKTVEAIREAFKEPYSTKYRAFVQGNYSAEKRKEKLLAILDEMQKK